MNLDTRYTLAAYAIGAVLLWGYALVSWVALRRARAGAALPSATEPRA
jgi:hypothetical protein